MKHFEIGSRIKNYQEASGTSKAELALRIGATPHQVTLYEVDLRNMRLERFVRICEALGANIVEMVK